MNTFRHLILDSSKYYLILGITVSLIFSPLVSISSMAAQNSSAEVPVLPAEGKKVVVEDPKTAEENNDEGMSTGMIVGLSVAGAAAVVGIVALAGSGSDSSSKIPTQETVLGPWHADAIGHVQGKGYTGTYTLYAGGGHTYNIVDTIDNSDRKSGSGHWELNGANITLWNDTGSVYVGTFSDGNTAVLDTTTGWWTLTLTR